MQVLNTPGPNSLFSLAFIRFRQNPLGFLQELTRRHGDFVAFKMLHRQMFYAHHPDTIRDVLVTHNANFGKGRALQKAKRILGDGLLTSEGEAHHRQRKLVLPAFHRQRIASYGSVMVEHALRTSTRWHDGDNVDISQEMTRLTLGIVAKTLFDSDVEKEADEIGEAMTVILEIFNLMMYPLQAELDAVLGGRTPSFDDIPQLRYTEMVVSESMRLFPPAWGIGRRSLVDQKVGPHYVPADAIILLSPYVTQRDARFFPDPDTFKPERWTEESKASMIPFSYFPFGGGTRRCIGEGFAWTELVLVLGTIASRWRVRMAQTEGVQPQALFTLRPKGGIRMRVEARG